MRVATPLGEYEFEFRRIERREDGIAVVGTMAGIESVVLLSRGEIARAAALAATLAAAGALAAAPLIRRR